MRQNKLKKTFKEGKAVVNGWLQIPSSFSAEVMANQGWDSLTVDMQHGVIDYPNALQMLQAISTTETVPLARVNWNDPGQIMKILDAGCYGVICPMISNRKEDLNFNLGETANMIRDTVKSFSDNEIAPRAAEIDKKNDFRFILFPGRF